RQLKENGLTTKQARWTSPGIRKVIEDYTRESGVRELERQIGAVCRAVAAKVARKMQDGASSSSATKTNGSKPRKPKSVPAIAKPSIDAQQVRELLGPEKYFRELDIRTSRPGVVVGLAYTPVGGEILFIEATSFHGRG